MISITSGPTTWTNTRIFSTPQRITPSATATKLATMLLAGSQSTDSTQGSKILSAENGADAANFHVPTKHCLAHRTRVSWLPFNEATTSGSEAGAPGPLNPRAATQRAWHERARRPLLQGRRCTPKVSCAAILKRLRRMVPTVAHAKRAPLSAPPQVALEHVSKGRTIEP